MKTCSKCKIEKPLTDFHRKSKTDNNPRSICKQCHYDFQKTYQNTDKYKAYRRGYLSRPETKELLKKQVQQPHRKAYYRKYHSSKKQIEKRKAYAQSERGKEVIKKIRTKYCKQSKNRIKIEARTKVNMLIRSGKLQKPAKLNCIHCSKKAEAYHHDEGYSGDNATNVVPVCYKCHAKLHHPL